MGQNNSSVAVTHNNLGGYYWKTGKLSEAKKSFQISKEILSSVGWDQPAISIATENGKNVDKGFDLFKPLFHDSHIGFVPERGLEVYLYFGYHSEIFSRSMISRKSGGSYF